MMGYLDRLKVMNSEKCLPSPLQELQKAPFDSFCSSQGGRFQKITPPDRETPEPTRACSTCAHVTGRGGCGEPVAAGLSDVVGVIRYHAHQGDGCPAWLAILLADLERRILAMAEQEAFEERAAIMEYDGGMSRTEAERLAASGDG